MVEPIQKWMETMRPMADKLRYAILLLMSILVAMSYHPSIEAMRTTGMVGAVILQRAIQLVFLVLVLLLVFDMSSLRHRFVKVSFILALGVLIFGLLVAVIFGQTGLLSEFKLLCPPLIALLTGMQVQWNRKRLLGFLSCFSVAIMITGLSVLFMQGGGFVISEIYISDHKNALGPMLSTAAIMLAFIFLACPESKKLLKITGKFLLLALILLLLLVVLTLRARAALLSMASILFLVLIQRYKGKSLLITLSVCVLLVLAVFFLLPDAMREYVHQSLFAGLSGDFTSGRAERNMQAIALIGDHPLFAQLVAPDNARVVHNFFLHVTSSFGLLFAFPLLALYVYLFVYIIKSIYHSDVKCMSNVGYYVTMVLLLVSFFEYTLPFGPGTVTFVNFVMLGMSLRMDKDFDKEYVVLE